MKTLFIKAAVMVALFLSSGISIMAKDMGNGSKDVKVFVQNRSQESFLVVLSNTIHVGSSRSGSTQSTQKIAPGETAKISITAPAAQVNADGSHNGIGAVANGDAVGCEAELKDNQQVVHFTFEKNPQANNPSKFICTANPSSDFAY